MLRGGKSLKTPGGPLRRDCFRDTSPAATAIISPKGTIVAEAQPDTETVLEGHVKGYIGETPYMKAGGSTWLISILAVIGVFLILIGRKKPE